MNRYRVEYLEENHWVVYSKHKNEEYAVINAKTISGRTDHVGVIWQGKTVFEIRKGE